jgi:hypothetical protein
MTQDEIEARIIEIIERAEYAGRQDMLAKKTTGNRIARNAQEAADVSSKMARLMALSLSEELVGYAPRLPEPLAEPVRIG